MTQALQPAQPLSPSIAAPDELRELVGPPPVLGSEDDRGYYAIVDRLTQSLAPRDFVEQLLVKEVADCFWEVRRYTRQKTLTMERGFRQHLRFPAHEAIEAQRAQEAGEAPARDEAEQGQPVEMPDAVDIELDHARALEWVMDTHERLNKLLITTVGRRNELLGELERHRIGLGQWSRGEGHAAAEGKQIAATALVPSEEPAQ